MGKYTKLRAKILAGSSDENISFSDLCQLLSRLGFDKRIKGDHPIFSKDDILEIINIQPRGSLAKQYQVKQIRELFVQYKLGETDVD